MSNDIQDLLAGILDETAPEPTAPPEQAVAVNAAGGDMGEAVMSKPDVFDGDDAPLSLPEECAMCGVPYPDADALECIACGTHRPANRECPNTWHELEEHQPGSKCLTCGVTAIQVESVDDVVKAITGGEDDTVLPASTVMAGFDATLGALPDAGEEVKATTGVDLQPEPVAKVSVETPTFTTDEIADTLDIRQFATLVTLNTSRWHAKVKDRGAAKDAAIAAGADSEAFETQKRLLVGADEKLKRIHKAIDTARTQHYLMTLPWSTVEAGATAGKRTGGRLLPNTLFMEYTTAMANCKAEMDAAIADFVPAYPTLIGIAQQKLGSRFDPTEYPNASSIQSHFGLSFDFLPIPQGGDFQGLADAQVKQLSASLNKKTRTMLENAMQEAWTRLHEVVSHAAEKLSDPDAMFHYTMVEKLRDAAKLLKHLNVTNDQTIEDVRTYVEKHLTMHDVKEIRKDDALRARLAKEAKVAVDMMVPQ